MNLQLKLVEMKELRKRRKYFVDLHQLNYLNREIDRLKGKIYYLKNIDKVKLRMKKYSTLNKEKLKEKYRAYRYKNKEKLKEKSNIF